MSRKYRRRRRRYDYDQSYYEPVQKSYTGTYYVLIAIVGMIMFMRYGLDAEWTGNSGLFMLGLVFGLVVIVWNWICRTSPATAVFLLGIWNGMWGMHGRGRRW